jgi:hypothetical protein
MIKKFEQVNSGKIEYDIKSDESISEFLEKHKLIDFRKSAFLLLYIIMNILLFNCVTIYRKYI